MIAGAHNKPTWQTVSSSSPIALTVWGDSIVGQALVLLLRGADYEANFLHASLPDKPISLEGSQLLVLTPTPHLSTEKRDALLASFFGSTPSAAEIPVLELTISPSKEAREGQAPNESSWYEVPWPCRINELEQWIETALSASPPSL
jgi:hypothetical protein